ncbi:MAG: SHOCT domain-containing protein [Tissierellia bacterium]|nr:SHOCT domain-containing protein [Tissierellia bacterium]
MNKLKNNLRKLWLLGALGSFIMGIIFTYLYSLESHMLFGICFLLSYITISIFIFVVYQLSEQEKVDEINRIRKQKEGTQKNQKYMELTEIYPEIKNNAKIPHNAKQIFITKDNTDLNLVVNQYYVWRDQTNLILFPFLLPYESISDETLRKEYYSSKIIDIDTIEYFATRGEVFRETKISGGGGGGSSIKGAVIGGVIAGGAGAVIGSRKKNQQIRSETITHDTRETFINIFIDDEVRKSLFLKFSDFVKLQDLLPEKEYGIVSTIKSTQIIREAKKAEQSKSIIKQIKELAELKDNGILTEEEFNNKKKELLAKI